MYFEVIAEISLNISPCSAFMMAFKIPHSDHISFGFREKNG